MPRTWKRRLASLVALCLMLTGLVAVTGCRSSADPARLVDKRLLYLGPDGKRAIVVDTAADGRPVSLSGPAAATFLESPPFTEGRLQQVNGEYAITSLYPPPYLIAPVIEAADPAAAATTYPAALLNWLCYGSDRYAITDYKLGGSGIIRSDGQRLDIQFTADLKPLRDPFRFYAGSGWADPESDGWLHGQTVTICVYRSADRYCLYHPDGAVFTAGPPARSATRPRPRYQSSTAGNPSEVWSAGGTCETVLYEDNAFSYLTSLRLAPDGLSFATGVSRVPASGGDPVGVASLPPGTWAAEAFAIKSGWLYLTTRSAVPFSETRPGEVGRLNLATGGYETLLPGRAHVLGTVGSTAYLIRADSQGKILSGIYSLDTLDGTLNRICPLPQADDYGPGTAAQLISFNSGTLTVAWLADEGYDAVPYPIFTIDVDAGTVTRVR